MKDASKTNTCIDKQRLTEVEGVGGLHEAVRRYKHPVTRQVSVRDMTYNVTV